MPWHQQSQCALLRMPMSVVNFTMFCMNFGKYQWIFWFNETSSLTWICSEIENRATKCCESFHLSEKGWPKSEHVWEVFNLTLCNDQALNGAMRTLSLSLISSVSLCFLIIILLQKSISLKSVAISLLPLHQMLSINAWKVANHSIYFVFHFFIYWDGNWNFHSRKCNYCILHANYTDKTVRVWIGANIRRLFFQVKTIISANWYKCSLWRTLNREEQEEKLSEQTFIGTISFSFSWFHPCSLCFWMEWASLFWSWQLVCKKWIHMVDFCFCWMLVQY